MSVVGARRLTVEAIALAAGVFLFPLILEAQSSIVSSDEAPEAAPLTNASRTDQPPVIDGRMDDAAWNAAPVISGLLQLDPREGQPVSERTEFRILFDDYNLYIGAWLYDRGRITGRLTRRDANWPDTDAVMVYLDTYHDHRTAYRFTLNPNGSRRDEVISGGGGGGGGGGGAGGGGGGGGGGFGGGGNVGTGSGDTTWDPVWEASTSQDGEGWYAELRIPFSQLRYSPDETQTWGLQLDRRIGRLGEYASWAFTPRTERATVARFGHLEGISGIRSAGKLELLPFVAARAEYRELPVNEDVTFGNPFRSGKDYFMDAGLDLKYQVTSNFALNGTINPDFGQVEMDPAEINLTAFETRLGERRPFFVEGAEIFNFGEGGGGMMSTQLLYTRRIGRAPQLTLPGGNAYSQAPASTTILGAVKLTGKTQNGWSLGLLEAVTDREAGVYMDLDGVRHERVVEPLSNYFVARARRDLNQGESAVGFFGTSVIRDLADEEILTTRLPSRAFTGGVDFRHEWANRMWSFSGDLSGNHVAGDSEAILRLQRSSARYFQRPDADHLEVDPDATSMVGYAGQVELSKQAGLWRGMSSIVATSPDYEVNDLGFQTTADRIQWSSNFGYEQPRPGRLTRRWSLRTGFSSGWNYGGDRIATDVNAFWNAQFTSFHGMNGRISRSFSTLNDRFTRGGPLVQEPAGYSASLGFNTDNRKRVTLRANASTTRDDSGSARDNYSINVNWRVSDAHEIQLGPSLNRTHTTAQYVTSVTDETAVGTYGRRFIFAPLDQTTFSLNTRLNMTFSPTLTLEVYAEPFISSGSYGHPTELSAPRTYSFQDFGENAVRDPETGRYTIDPDGAGPAESFEVADLDFNFHSLLGNAVLRWEWRPGSTIFLVWQQSRSERLTAALAQSGRVPGDFDFERDARALFGLEPENVFLIKFNYWLNR